MRQRKLKDESEKIAAYSEYLIEIPKSVGNWRNALTSIYDKDFSKSELFLEIGCGKGQFISALAMQNDNAGFIGIEGRGSVILRALEKAQENDLKNILFIREFVSDLSGIFSESEISGIYLNFSDPWPKDRHAKRRLNSRAYLQCYKKIVKKGGFVAIKTDNEALFEYGLFEIKACDLNVTELSRDLHHSSYHAKEVTTEYEDKFHSAKKPIFYCKIQL